MDYEVKLKGDATGRLSIEDGKTTRHFSTPDSNGREFARLFKDIKEGDIIVVNFRDIRICPSLFFF